MNINKKAMDMLYNQRQDPEKMQKLLENFYEMGSQIAHHFDIPYSMRADYIQSAVILSWRKLDKFDPIKNKHAFSYFYQVIRRDFMDNMRKAKKRSSIAKMISSDDSRNDWLKNMKYFDHQYEVVEHNFNKQILTGLKKIMWTELDKTSSDNKTSVVSSP